MAIDGERKQLFFETVKRGFGKCLWPTMKCPNDAIKAHSVQKSTALSHIEEDGHVVELKMKIVDERPTVRFIKVGRNEASTFDGLCNEHDTSLFLPIDTKPLDLNNREQLFLVAYRSVTRELHAVMRSAVLTQTTFQSLVSRGEVPKDEPSAAGIAAVEQFHKSWLVWKHRFEHYDLALAKGRYDTILHSTFVIAGRRPVLASSSFFAVDDRRAGERTARVALNLIPTGGDETAVVFSYPKTQSQAARRRIASVMTKLGDERIAALSNLILDATENFFMRPSHVAAWSDEKRRRIEAAYMSTVSEGVDLQPSSELMLF